MSKTKDAAGVNADMVNLSFEEAVKKLETIVEAMEAQDLPLETLLARFEEGTRLAQFCQAKLSDLLSGQKKELVCPSSDSPNDLGK